MNRGFTLIEVLLSLAIVSVIVGILFVLATISLNAYNKCNELLELTKKAQIIFSTLNHELRSIFVDTNNSFVINSDNIEFSAIYYGSEENKYKLYRIGYKVEDGNLKRYYKSPDGNGNWVVFADRVDSINFDVDEVDNKGVPSIITITVRLKDNRDNLHMYVTKIKLYYHDMDG